MYKCAYFDIICRTLYKLIENVFNYNVLHDLFAKTNA